MYRPSAGLDLIPAAKMHSEAILPTNESKTLEIAIYATAEDVRLWANRRSFSASEEDAVRQIPM